MCRNIKTLFNFDPVATNEEIHSAALQYVRKLSGFNMPSQANKSVFDQTIKEIEHISQHFLSDLVTQAEPRNREVEAAKAHARALQRFGTKAT